MDGDSIPLIHNPRTRTLAKWINVIAVAVTIWTLIIHLPYTVSIAICAIVPLFAIIVVIYSRGTIQGVQLKKSNFPHLTYSIIGPSSVLAMRALLDFNIYDGQPLILPVLFVCVLLMFLLYRYDNGMKGRITGYILILPVILLYGFGVIMEANCIFDKSTPQIHSARVIDKYTSGGGYRSLKSYYLKVSSWGKNDTENRIPVPRSLYEKITKDDSVDIALKEGAVGIPWYGVRVHKQGL